MRKSVSIAVLSNRLMLMQRFLFESDLFPSDVFSLHNLKFAQFTEFTGVFRCPIGLWTNEIKANCCKLSIKSLPSPPVLVSLPLNSGMFKDNHQVITKVVALVPKVMNAAGAGAKFQSDFFLASVWFPAC